MRTREVWITGCGAISAAGLGVPALANSLMAERSSVSVDRIGGPPVGRSPDPPPFRAGRKLDRSARLFIAAAAEAWDSAGLAEGAADPCRLAVFEGSSLGPMAELIDAARRTKGGGDRRARPTDIVRFMTGAGGAAFAQARGIGGPVLHVSGGSISSACAIGEAGLWIDAGRFDVVVAGGAESPLHDDVLGLFRAAGILAVRDGHPDCCRPFDAERCGTCLGEGAGVLVLEAGEHARARGARPLAILQGYGTGCEPHSMTAPDPDGCAVRAAVAGAVSGMVRAGFDPASEIGWIKAHATGTRRGDASECRGLAAALGASLADIPMTGLKSRLGHCLGASGAVEAVAVLVALQNGNVPRTVGTRRVDPQLPACHVALGSERSRVASSLLLSESFGGRTAALLLRAA
jgi:3-oxoacyl-[acyl-carrier-protein] synthase II